MNHINTLAEELADFAINLGYDSSMDALESFAEALVDGFCEINQIRLDDVEREALESDFQIFVEDMAVPEADQLIRDWNKEACEEYYEIEEARRGQY